MIGRPVVANSRVGEAAVLWVAGVGVPGAVVVHNLRGELKGVDPEVEVEVDDACDGGVGGSQDEVHNTGDYVVGGVAGLPAIVRQVDEEATIGAGGNVFRDREVERVEEGFVLGQEREAVAPGGRVVADHGKSVGEGRGDGDCIVDRVRRVVRGVRIPDVQRCDT